MVPKKKKRKKEALKHKGSYNLIFIHELQEQIKTVNWNSYNNNNKNRSKQSLDLLLEYNSHKENGDNPKESV